MKFKEVLKQEIMQYGLKDSLNRSEENILGRP